MRATVACAVGERPDLTPAAPARAAAIRFVFGEEDLAVLARIRKTRPDALYFVSELEALGSHAITDSGSRLGFYILTAERYEEILSLSELTQ